MKEKYLYETQLDQKIIDKIAEYNQKYGKVVRRIVTEPIEISSGEIRKKIQSGLSVSALIPSAVEKYIADKHLYG